MVMGLVQIGLLVLGAALLADAQLPHPVKWLNPRSPWSPGTYYSQNQVQAFSPYGSSMTPRGYSRIEPNTVLNIPQPPVTFYPRTLSVEPAVSHVQTHIQDPVFPSALIPSLASGPHPPVWNLVQTPVQAHFQEPVLETDQDSAPNPLPVPSQAPAEDSSVKKVWNPVQSPLPVPADNPNAVLIQDSGYTSSVPVLFHSPPQLSVPSTGPGLAHDLSLVSVQVPAQTLPLPSGPNAVLTQDSGPTSVPVPFQSFPQLSVPSTGQGLTQAPSLVSVQVPAQPIPLPSGPNAVLIQDSGPTSVPVPFQSFPQLSGSSTGLGLTQAPSLVPSPAQNLPLPIGPNAVVTQDSGPASVPVPFQTLPQLSGSSTGLGLTQAPSLVPSPAQNLALPSGPVAVLLPAQDSGPTSVPVPFQSLPQLSGPSTDLGPAHDQGPAPGVAPALTSSPSAVLLTPSPASPWNPDQTPNQTAGQSAQESLPALNPYLPQLQVNVPTEPIKKLMWRFPKAPERPMQAPVQFDLRQPTLVHSVAAACGESAVHVEVKQDFFGNGKLIHPSSLTLGGCAAAGLDSAARVIIFNSELQACGSVVMMTDDNLIYSFHLLYQPEPVVGTPIVRTGSVNVQIECHYSRKHNVSSNAVAPTWLPYSSTVAAEEHLVFTLKLMTDDWQYERPSNQYFLGEFMNIEASVTQFNHAPLRVFVDRCVATAVPDVNAVPRYSFIENHGCLIDAKITGSNSQFMKRVQDDELQFQLEVFRFEQANSSALYIACFLKVSTALQKNDAEHKACSFQANGWSAADGDDQDCNCCDSECFSRNARSVPTDKDQYIETKVFLGPILVEDEDHLLH